MLALLLVLLGGGFGSGAGMEGEVQASWRCEPTRVELGQPFRLVLELAHPPGSSGRELAAGTLALDDSWVVLGEEALTSVASEDGQQRTRRAWSVASLEAGERALAQALSSVALSERVTRIQVGDARIEVLGVLAAGEDEPRPLREFPPGFADGSETPGAGRWFESGVARWLGGGLAGLLLALLAGFAWRRRRSRGAVPAPPAPIERLGELERASKETGGREECYALTQLLREASDGLRRKPGRGLTDEEWLAEVVASLEIPRGTVAVLEEVFERTTRVKYGGEAPTPWALEETFTRARAALESLGTGGARP